MRYITAAIGNFDGIHIGHDKIIKKCIEIGSKNNQEKKIITFEYDFEKFENLAKRNKKIYGKNGKIASLKSYDIDDIIFFSLNEKNAKMAPETFVRDVLIDELRIKNIVVGFNFRFGHKAQGDIELLKSLSGKYDYNVEVVNAVIKNDYIVSSTIIRKLIENGNIKNANNLLMERFRIDLRDHEAIKLSEAELFIKDAGYVYPAKGKYLVLLQGKEEIIEIRNIESGIILKGSKEIYTQIIEFIKEI
jgi:riboflavin kinase/FMN adenylyltransferase